MVVVALAAVLVGGCADDPSEPEALLRLSAADSGDIVGLIANESDDGRFVEWIDRLDGTIQRVDIDADADEPAVEEVGRIEIGTEPNDQRGLLGQVVIDGRRFASWTQPESFDIVVGEVVGEGEAGVDGAAGEVLWSGGESSGGAVGGVLDELDGEILLGLGQNTAWDAETGVRGAMLVIDPGGGPGQIADVLSVGYTNPWAFTVTGDGAVWVADNAAGEDPGDASREDIERVGRADLIADRADMVDSSDPGRAPSAMVELPDGRIAICGFLDNELRAYEVLEGDDANNDASDGANAASGERLDRAGTIMSCLTGVAVFDDGTIVTATQDDTGQFLQILRS